MTVECPSCDLAIPSDDVNVDADTAYCRACGTLTQLSALAAGEPSPLEKVDPGHPPAGCRSDYDGMQQTVVARSGAGCGTLLGLLVFCVFWNGITGVFVLVVIASTLQLMGVAQPAWLPAPTMDEPDGMGLGMTLFMWLFLLPFIAVGLSMLGSLLVAMAGRVAVRYTAMEGTVFVGVGPAGWRRRFDPRRVTGVGLGKTGWEKNGQKQPVVVMTLDGGKKLRFGSLLADERRAWLAAELRRLLIVEPAAVD